MSHFIVMVAGDVEGNLAPFHEFECTGVDDEFVVPVDETEAALVEYALQKEGGDLNKVDVKDGDTLVKVDEDFITWASDYYGREVVEVGQEPDIEGTHKYGFIQKFADGTCKLVNRTNPDAKWDWYVEGGRWKGYFQHKDGSQVDVICKGDIDLQGIRETAVNEAVIRYAKAQTAIDGRSWDSWETVRKTHSNIDYAREVYNAQPVIEALHKAFAGEWMLDPEQFRVTSEEFITRAANSGLVPYAFVQNRHWAQRGEMGWWGIAHNEMSRDEWNAAFWEWLNALPDDTILTAVDCHI